LLVSSDYNMGENAVHKGYDRVIATGFGLIDVL
jgi:hypothetical protein